PPRRLPRRARVRSVPRLHLRAAAVGHRRDPPPPVLDAGRVLRDQPRRLLVHREATPPPGRRPVARAAHHLALRRAARPFRPALALYSAISLRPPGSLMNV